jgi:cell division protein FtsW
MQKKSIDTTLVFLVLGLMIFGMIMISSVSVYSSFKITSLQVAQGRLEEASNAFYLLRNMAHVSMGVLMLVIFSKTPYTFLEKYSRQLFIGTLFLLALVFVPGVGTELNGAKGWIDLPGIPSIQPVEFMKITIMIMLAYFMKRRKSFLSDFERGFIPYFSYVAVVFVLLALQPDFGSILILMPIVVAMFFIGGGNRRLITIILVIGVLGALTVYGIGKTDIGKNLKIGYIADRIDNFLRSSKSITESNNNDQKDYQLKQGFIAQGSGGFFGL